MKTKTIKTPKTPKSPKMDKQHLSKFVKERIVGSPHGVQCYFIPIDEKWAIKVYDCKYERNECFENQKRAQKYGLGPITGKKINLPVGDKKFGYFTEIVETLTSIEYNHYVAKGLVGTLIEELEQIGLYFGDCYHQNVGIKDGQLICIDFGMMY